jgi:methylglutaconyl-CoA hydratase
MIETDISTHIENGIGSIEFYSSASNSLPAKVLKELAEGITALDADPNVKVIVLKSRGEKAFCGGASFDELIAIQDEKQGLEFFSGFARVINAMRKAQKLIIGRVQGKAVGGGVGLAAATDFCIATESAAIKLSELAVGIGPFVVGPAVERKVGLTGMSDLAINATEWRSAAWAREKGLYTEVCTHIEELDDRVGALALRLAQSSPEAMIELKKMFWQGTEHWDQLLVERAQISGRLVLSEFTKNFIQSFKSKS